MLVLIAAGRGRSRSLQRREEARGSCAGGFCRWTTKVLGGGVGLLVVVFGRFKRWWRWWREREKIENYHLTAEIGGES